MSIAILKINTCYLEKLVALLVIEHTQRGHANTAAEDRNVAKGLQLEYLKITNEAIRAAQEALTTINTSMMCAHVQAVAGARTRPQQLQLAHATAQSTDQIEKWTTDRHFTDIVVQSLTEEDRKANLSTWKDPNYHLPNILAVHRHLYPHGLQRNKTGRITGSSTMMATR